MGAGRDVVVSLGSVGVQDRVAGLGLPPADRIADVRAGHGDRRGRGERQVGPPGARRGQRSGKLLPFRWTEGADLIQYLLKVGHGSGQWSVVSGQWGEFDFGLPVPFLSKDE